jgi:AcrR family transcriptional regulator
LLREGKPPSMQEAADRALVSIATAYRYFPSAEDLWWEASADAESYQPILTTAAARIDAAGTAPLDRMEALIRTAAFHMFDEQVTYRQSAKAALDQWFRQADKPEHERWPIRKGRRNDLIALVIEPLRGELPAKDVDRIARALGVVFGTDAMIALLDGVGLSVSEAKKTLLDASRWLLAGALAELDGATRPTRTEPSTRG